MNKKLVDFFNVDLSKYKPEIKVSCGNRVEDLVEGFIASLDTIFYVGSFLPAFKQFAALAVAAGNHSLGFKFPENAVAEGPGVISQIGDFAAKNGWKKALIVTDKNMVKFGQVTKVTESLTKAGVGYAIYDGVVPDPTIENIEGGYKTYLENGCDVIIGLGGGSPIDTCKAVAGRVVRPARKPDKMGGLFGVTLPDVQWIFKKPANYPKTICIPTTSGTGADTTFSSVISNRRTGRKYTINDTSLQPDYTFLDPELSVTMDPEMTALTGIDALSHRVEAYLGIGRTRKSNKLSREGIKLIFDNLDTAVAEPDNIQARENMMIAAHKGGQVLITGETTYVHPFAHKVGAMTHLTHGYLIGSFMPPILEWYRPQADKRLAELAELIGVADPILSVEDNAEAFIQAIRELCAKYGIDGKVPQIATLDYKEIIKSIRIESFPYPVPKVMTNDEMIAILDEVAGK